MEKKINYPVMDIFKFIFCIFIVGIHTQVFVENQIAHYWVEKALFRIAVPYFVVCSGFLLAEKIDRKEVYIRDDIEHFSNKLIRILILFEPISIILKTVIFSIEGRSGIYIVLRILQSVIFYPYGALWYVQAMIIGLWLLYYFVLKDKKLINGFIIGAPLFLFAFICNTYYFVISETYIGEFVSLYLKIAVSARNGLFYGFFMLWIGFVAYYIFKNNYFSIKLTMYLLFISYFAYLIELFFLYGIHFKDDGSIFIMTLPVVLFLLLFSVNYRDISGSTLAFRNLSLGVYLTHRPVLYIINILELTFAFVIPFEEKFLIVTFVSLVVSYLFFKLKYNVE